VGSVCEEVIVVNATPLVLYLRGEFMRRFGTLACICVHAQ
jgi:hypothetical protein